MIWRYPALCIVFIIFFCLVAFCSIAQPTLPDIAGSAEKGIVILSWNCQYTGIKYISVLRSHDSINYAIIGKLKKVNKGVQVYVDEKPIVGNNCYKLVMVFSSGLNWSSNHCVVYVNISDLDSSKPVVAGNDLSQPHIASIDTVTPFKTSKMDTTAKLDVNNIAHVKSIVKQADTLTSHSDAIQISSTKKIYPDTFVATRPKISLSFEQDTNHVNPKDYVEDPRTFISHRKRIIIPQDQNDNVDPSTLIKSHFIFTDSLTGNINMYLPDDVSKHHYSVKFYDDKGKMAVDIPKIITARIIIDKRNFQRKGIYKFVLRRDVVELETGYAMIIPNP